MPAVDLPDVNVWLALADADHAHHAAARRYWEAGEADELVFCRVTMLGLMRLATHPKVMHGRPWTASQAWKVWRGFSALPEVSLRPEPAGIGEILARLSDKPDFPQALWTDAYLAAVALAAGWRLVSFDGDFRRFPGLHFLRLDP